MLVYVPTRDRMCVDITPQKMSRNAVMLVVSGIGGPWNTPGDVIVTIPAGPIATFPAQYVKNAGAN